ncbi:hypothetical protein Q1695_012407 [Nippostrongylus brasiliensis]|nr:hypothetical protein Q1695_012407 [Nippostrongylus brasiliensis]
MDLQALTLSPTQELLPYSPLFDAKEEPALQPQESAAPSEVEAAAPPDNRFMEIREQARSPSVEPEMAVEDIPLPPLPPPEPRRPSLPVLTLRTPRPLPDATPDDHTHHLINAHP